MVVEFTILKDIVLESAPPSKHIYVASESNCDSGVFPMNFKVRVGN
jgi:hypothetical protein